MIYRTLFCHCYNLAPVLRFVLAGEPFRYECEPSIQDAFFILRRSASTHHSCRPSQSNGDSTLLYSPTLPIYQRSAARVFHPHRGTARGPGQRPSDAVEVRKPAETAISLKKCDLTCILSLTERSDDRQYLLTRSQCH
jgi:hypothetical protein